jgi:VWFA-related protein
MTALNQLDANLIGRGIGMLNLIQRVAFATVLVGAETVLAQHPSYTLLSAEIIDSPIRAQIEAIPTIRTTSSIVVLDVVVTDSKGNLVQRKLSQNDFEVFEDRVPQIINSFEPPDKHELPVKDKEIVASASDLKEIGNSPVTILVLDELNSRFEDMSYSRQMLIKYLQSQPEILKQPTVVMLATNRSFQQLHDYTQRRNELIAAVKKHMPEYPWRMMKSGKGGPGAVERMGQVLAALQQIAQSSTGTAGRKNLIWVGNGFPTVDLVALEEKQAGTLEAAIRRCTSRLLAAHVTMYIVNPAATSSATIDIQSPDDLSSGLTENGADPFNSGEVSFLNFAPSTGGISFTGRNDLNNVIKEGVNKGQEYYSISYSPSNKSTDPSTYRKIRIRMSDPSLRATTRGGYYQENTEDLDRLADKTTSYKQVKASLEMELSAAIVSRISYNGLSVVAEESSDEQYLIHVAEKGLAWSDPVASTSQHSEATVGAAWYNSKGILLGHIFREEVFPRGQVGTGAIYSLPIALPVGAARLRFVVRDALNGEIGTFDIDNLSRSK